jgi:hypothetical protein
MVMPGWARAAAAVSPIIEQPPIYGLCYLRVLHQTASGPTWKQCGARSRGRTVLGYPLCDECWDQIALDNDSDSR